MRHQPGLPLVQIMDCRPFGAKLLYEPMLYYCHLDAQEQTSIKLYSKFKYFIQENAEMHLKYCLKMSAILFRSQFVNGRGVVNWQVVRTQISIYVYIMRFRFSDPLERQGICHLVAQWTLTSRNLAIFFQRGMVICENNALANKKSESFWCMLRLQYSGKNRPIQWPLHWMIFLNYLRLLWLKYHRCDSD